MWNREGIIDRLRELIEVDKISFADAAEIINAEFRTSFSRMALIGQARRKGVKVPPERINSPAGTRKPRKKDTRQFHCTTAKAGKQYPTIVDADIPLAQRRTILELNSGTCKWPVGEPGTADFFFCGGEAVNNGPYCAGHHARAYEAYRGKPNLFVKWRRAA